MNNDKPIYKLVDGKGRVLIPKALRDAAKMEYGDIVRLGFGDGRVSVYKVDIIEAGNQSPEAVEAFVRSVFLTSLSDGEQHRFYRRDVIGTLKPELLPDSAKLQLSQIRPSGALPLEHNPPEYSGYSFLEDGRYAAGVWLCSLKEVMDYVEMQKPYQHRVLICDRDDFAVMEVAQGQLVFPTQEELEVFRQGKQEPDGGMKMT